jgi:hypothetical protein
MDVPAFERVLPEESVSPTSFQQVPHAGPAPAPGPTPKLENKLVILTISVYKQAYTFWLAAALKPGKV